MAMLWMDFRLKRMIWTGRSAMLDTVTQWAQVRLRDVIEVVEYAITGNTHSLPRLSSLRISDLDQNKTMWYG